MPVFRRSPPFLVIDRESSEAPLDAPVPVTGARSRSRVNLGTINIINPEPIDENVVVIVSGQAAIGESGTVGVTLGGVPIPSGTILTDFRAGSTLGTDIQTVGMNESIAESYIDDFNGTQGRVAFVNNHTETGPGVSAYVLKHPSWQGNTGDRSIDLGMHLPSYPAGEREVYYSWKWYWGRIAGDGVNHGREGYFDPTNDEVRAFCSGFSGTFVQGEILNFSGGKTAIQGNTDNSTYIQFEMTNPRPGGGYPTSGTVTGATSGAVCTINSAVVSTLNAGGKRFRSSGWLHTGGATPGISMIMGASQEPGVDFSNPPDGTDYRYVQWRLVGAGIGSNRNDGVVTDSANVGIINTVVLYVKCSSSAVATDGELGLWLNDVKLIEDLNIATPMASMNRWKVPTAFRDPEEAMTEYCWDMVAWKP